MDKLTKYINIPPESHLLISSLRSVGYNPETAIADIADNCISAGADLIKIQLIWNEINSKILIIDNGEGIVQEHLIEAMKIGSNVSKNNSCKNNLGRFGMGMKTAAFSIGKKLSVVSKVKQKYSYACWDIDFIKTTATGEWNLIIENQPQFNILLDEFENGTAIIIEILDKIIPKRSNNLSNAKKNFYELIENISRHLGLIFHRFIEENNLKIFVNNRLIIPWNPFCLDNKATQELNEEKFYKDGKEITIQPYILPHKTKFKTEEEYKLAEGPYGIVSHQGIYVYRNHRLIVYGTWFNYIKKEPAFNLARIKLDISSENDFDWKIDIKKSSAIPPLYIREILYRTIDICTEASAKVYNSRGIYSKNTMSPSLEYVWEQRKNRNGTYSFKINKKHPILSNVMNKIDRKIKEELLLYLALVENYAPFIQSKVADFLQSPPDSKQINQNEYQANIDLAEIKNYIRIFLKNGYVKEEVKSIILNMENFKYLKTAIEKIFEEEHYD